MLIKDCGNFLLSSMCAPVSVTTLHAVLTANLLQAWYVSQVLGAMGTIAAVIMSLRTSLVDLVKTKMPRLFYGLLSILRISRTQ